MTETLASQLSDHLQHDHPSEIIARQRLPHLARQFDLMVKGARSLDLGSWEDRFDDLRRAACDGTITPEQIADLIDYDYQTGQDPKAGVVTLITAILRDALRIP